MTVIESSVPADKEAEASMSRELAQGRAQVPNLIWSQICYKIQRFLDLRKTHGMFSTYYVTLAAGSVAVTPHSQMRYYVCAEI